MLNYLIASYRML